MRAGATDHVTSRRRFLSRLGAVGGLVPAAVGSWARLLAQVPCLDSLGPGEFVRALPLYGPGAQETPLERLVGGEGLDARLFTDLSELAADRLITPTDRVFVRTTAPPGLTHDSNDWSLRLGGDDASTITASAFVREARPMGAHLIECAGNSNPRHFGLMSAVEWQGVPLASVLSRMPRTPGAHAVLVAGDDPSASRTERSVPGASWLLSPQDIARHAPFLATGMNGQPLTPDHGAPVRIVVPGWYGCAWIKWVRDIRWVGPDEPSTPQMLEFAARTHQDGRPPRARDYVPPVIDTAAMPVRVEQRRVDGHVEYHVVGIVWGGGSPVDRLLIRFGSRDRGTPVHVCPTTTSHHTWALWTHRWRPAEPGYYDISLRVADPSVRTRRLDLSFYIRRVRIDEV